MNGKKPGLSYEEFTELVLADAQELRAAADTVEAHADEDGYALYLQTGFESWLYL